MVASMLRAQRRDPAKAQAKCAFATNYPLANRQLRSPSYCVTGCRGISLLKKMLDDLPQIRNLVNSIIIDNTQEGMRIQIVDQKGLAMFPSGSANMHDHTRKVLELVAQAIGKMPQDLSITGHTDSTRFSGGELGYTNWELSADRANATRRALIELGVSPDRLAKVVGAADQDPLVKEDTAAAKNRRIAIVLLRGTGGAGGS